MHGTLNVKKKSDRPCFTPIHNNTQYLKVLYILIFVLLVIKLKTKDAATNDSKHSLASVCSSGEN